MEVTTEKRKNKGEEDEPVLSHHKYCHFCQHVKIRSCAMLGCQNKSCMRRFCRHCLVTHLGEEDDNSTEKDDAQTWYCPICRNKCCCAKAECTENHRHCKAYRYRCSRAEKSIKRASSSSCNKKKRPSSTNRSVSSSGASVLEMERDGSSASGGVPSIAALEHAEHDMWQEMLRPDDDKMLLSHDESSPPPLTVYESGTEPPGHELDRFDKFEDVDERVMSQLLGRMHTKQPCWLREADEKNEVEWLRQSYLVVYQQHEAPGV